MIFNRPPLEERIAARQRERGPLMPGKYFEHSVARNLFIFGIAMVVFTHLAAFVMIFFEPGG
ncbi:hypothetical protein [Actinomadura rudentiformis]|uniref:hypothetical protein n=1 Tax=Actinomadura rudentiformis TaxID=359158 RepID=UPI001CEF6993|nr:hypothetical protein [Actinomadura rudentiformis]